MKLKNNIKARNTKNQFWYPPYPIFIIKHKSGDKHYYPCFKCRKAFKKRYRLSRYMYYSRFLKKDIIFINNRLNINENNKNSKKDFTINNSSLITYVNDFKNKKREMSSFCENNINNNIYTNEKKPIILIIIQLLVLIHHQNN